MIAKNPGADLQIAGQLAVAEGRRKSEARSRFLGKIDPHAGEFALGVEVGNAVTVMHRCIADCIETAAPQFADFADFFTNELGRLERSDIFLASR